MFMIILILSYSYEQHIVATGHANSKEKRKSLYCNRVNGATEYHSATSGENVSKYDDGVTLSLQKNRSR